MESFEEWLESRLTVHGRSGSEWNLSCPYHQAGRSGKPDLYVNVEKGVFNCVSTACGAKGTALTLIRFIDGVGHYEARRVLGSDTPAKLRCLLLDLDALTSGEPEPSLSLSPTLIRELRSDRYWSDVRGLSPETCDHFQLGFDLVTDRAVIPYYDARGRPVCFIERLLRGRLRYLYPRGFDQDALFHLDQIDAREEVIVVEGSIDAMKVYQAGLRNVVALLGSNVSEGRLRKLRHLKLVSFFDNDPAGVVATTKLLQSFPKSFRVARYPRGATGTDPDGLTAAEVLGAIDRAVPSLDLIPRLL